jgi:formamidopyrimidine-DNA glycosylase
MSGDLFVRAPDTPFATHDRLVLDLGDLPVRGIEEQAQPVRLVFNDPRKFGRAWLTNDPEEMFENLGPEPLDPNLTEFDFFQRLHKSRRQIKPLLMDQAFLAGMGNIYTDEALFLAKLNPVASADGLTLAQSSLLLRCIRQVLQDGIAQQGASIDWVYRGGDFQNYFRVYRRTGEPCPECGTEIHRTVVGQRSTHFCPQCQALTSVKEGFPVE